VAVFLALDDVDAAVVGLVAQVDSEIRAAREYLIADLLLGAEQVGDQQLEVVVGERGEVVHGANSRVREAVANLSGGVVAPGFLARFSRLVLSDWPGKNPS
jgi:hypothetical protein